MKKIITAVVALFVLTSTALAGDIPVQVVQLPGQAQNFIKKHFKETQVAGAKQVSDAPKSYQVSYVDGSTVNFDAKGNWTKVECKDSALPDGLVPKKLSEYVAENHPGKRIVGIEKEAGGNYGIDLSDGKTLKFDKSYKLVGMQ